VTYKTTLASVHQKEQFRRPGKDVVAFVFPIREVLVSMLHLSVRKPQLQVFHTEMTGIEKTGHVVRKKVLKLTLKVNIIGTNNDIGPQSLRAV